MTAADPDNFAQWGPIGQGLLRNCVSWWYLMILRGIDCRMLEYRLEVKWIAKKAHATTLLCGGTFRQLLTRTTEAKNDFEDGAWVTASYARTRVRYRALSFGRDLCRKSQYPMVKKSSQIVHARKLVDIWTAGRNFTWLHSGSKRSESLHSRDQALQREVNFGVGWKAAAPGFLPAGNFMLFAFQEWAWMGATRKCRVWM